MSDPINAYQDAVAAIDAARIQLSSGMRNDPDAYNRINAANATAVKRELMNEKMNAFLQVESNMARTQDMGANLKLYQLRTSDTDYLATQLENSNKSIDGQLDDDSAVTRRQFEINEWYSYKKQETAGMLMGVAIGLGLLLIATVGMKTGFLSSGAFQGLALFLIVCIGIWIWWRVSYNGHGRDPILWHRRRFGTSDIDPVKSKCNPETGEMEGPSWRLPGCIGELANKMAALEASAAADILAYGDGATSSSKGICSSTT